MVRYHTFFFSLACLVLGGAASARAQQPAAGAAPDDKSVCLDAASQTQTLRDAHKLLTARDQARLCARQVCPAAVQMDCASWLDAIEQALPSVVVLAKDQAGNDLFDVTVTLDGKPLTNKLQGDALPVDPGTHGLHFETPDGATLDQKVIVAEGTKAQRIAVVLNRPGVAPAPTASSSGGGQAPAPAEPSHGVPTLAWVGFGIGAAGIVVGSVTGILAMGKASTVSGECSGNTCPPSVYQGDLSSGRTMGNVSTVAFIVGGVGAAGGLAALLLIKPGGDEPAPSAATVQPWIGPGSAGLRGAF